MPGIQLVVDPEGVAFAFSSENGISLFSPLKAPMAQAEKQWSSNIDTEGQLPAGSQEQNTSIVPKLRLVGANEDQFRERQIELDQIVGKLRSEGGVLRIIYPDGSWIDWEVRDVTGGERLFDNRYIHSLRTEDELTFVCAPFGVGAEELVGEYEFEGEAKRVLECLVQVKKGSAPALGRAVVTSTDADVWELRWGKESRQLSEDSTALAHYPATALTPLGGAAATTATVDGKAGVPVIRQATLSPNWAAMFATGPLTHEGAYEAIAWVHMPTSNSGQVGFGFEYGVGDMVHMVPLDPTYFDADHPREGKVVMVPLGQVFIEAPDQGEHRWEGRGMARSTTTGDDLEVLDFALRPLAEGNGRISVYPTLSQPTALLTRDELNQSAGNLNEKVLASAGSIAGPNSPSTVANESSGGGSVAWTALENAKSVNGLVASAKASGIGITQYLKATKFGFAIPEGSIINGISVEVVRGREDTPSEIADNSLKLVKAGAQVGSNRANPWSLWPLDSLASAYYGTPFDLWGTTWTPAQVNAETFGVALAAAFANGKGDARVDGIRVTVFYEEAGGQKWATSGDPDDFTVETTGHTAQRTAVSDASINTGRHAIAGTTVTRDVVVGVISKRGGMEPASNEKVRRAAEARYVDANNWLQLCIDADYPSAPLTQSLRIIKRVAGTVTELGKVSIPVANSIWQSLWLKVDRRGRYFCWASLLEGGAARLVLAGQDNHLAEGEALDDGRNGFYDSKTGSLANTRNFDQLVVWIPPLDAAIYKGKSLELGHSFCQREAEGGGAWTNVTPKGDYLKLEPGGRENRKNRLVLIASPHDPDLMGVGFPPKLKVSVFAKPRYRTVPDPA